jgi:hypothetical protein
VHQNGLGMDSKSLAISFVKYFCNADLAGIDLLLSTQFKLTGPLYEFNSKQNYLDSLEGNLDPDPDSVILSVTGNEDESAAFYTYKGNVIGQLFRCQEGKIFETLLVFDADKFKR